MNVKPKQIEIALSVPAIVGILPAQRQTLVANAGRQAAALLTQAGLTIREQQAAMAIADLYLQFCQQDENNQKWSALMEAAIRHDEEKATSM
ncbi:hypothetical protein [Sporomusa malonica]|uniref:Uncharacterized protein n=1 Tax=Sporomusa malonica TaxID=112901 RepID=A0A1W2BFS9_9FIRM|nr:hypothetical protein [Sporomusa malonica]SMC71873.1 hypothetical protein SAMN04488500_107159 [Sporomusa malonica]